MRREQIALPVVRSLLKRPWVARIPAEIRDVFDPIVALDPVAVDATFDELTSSSCGAHPISSRTLSRSCSG